MSFEPINVFDYQARAEQVLHKDHWDFIDAGDFDELTVRRNRTAFDAISLRPKFMVDVQNRDLSTTVLGQKINFPVLLAPCAGQGRCHDEAEKGGRFRGHVAGHDLLHQLQLPVQHRRR